MRIYRESIDVSSQQWFELLQDNNVFKDDDIALMKALFNCKNHKEKASVLATILGVSGHSVLNLQIGRLGKRIIDNLPNVKFPSRENGSIRYWHIPFWAEDANIKGQYIWELRPELKTAIERVFDSEKDSSIGFDVNNLLAVEISEEEAKKLFEGSQKRITVNAYERNLKARQLCIQRYGYKCSVCGFDFEDFYGEIGIGYIEVHHLKPLNEINEEYQVNPIVDLKPVCPNCHSMLHKANVSITELKEIINKTKVIELDGQAAYVEGMPVYEPRLILDFGERIRIIQYNGESCTVRPQSFSLVKDGAANQDAQQILTYLRDISQYTSDNPEEEAFLKREMEQLTFVHPESVLSRYLNRQAIESRTPDINSIIFPFRFNLSQKAALKNALTSSISVIEGPPGTGKTQTILNIIANLVAIQGKSVAVVSNNNEAVKNVIEKMAEKGYGFLTALLGKVSNQDIFFNNMPVARVDGWDCEEEKAELNQQIEALNIKLNHLLNIDRKRAQLWQELRAWQLEQEHFEEYYARQNVEEIGKLPLFKATPDRIISFLADTSFEKEQSQSNKLLYKLKLLFKYGVFDHKKLQQQELSILLSLQREFYRQQTRKLESEIAVLESKLDGASFDVLIGKHQQYSEKLFRKCLYQSHIGLKQPDFTKKSFKVRFQEFIRTFPVILSTTHALRRSIPQNYLLDYVIIDEASQVDILTGTLAFSCCRNVIIVGDVKQLP